jgi:hypothetical protein
LLTDLLKLGVSFRARLSEPDLEVYAEMIEARLDDREWAYGEWTDPGEAPRFMPTPQELISIGRGAPRPPTPPTEEQIEFRRRYFAAARERRALRALEAGHGEPQKRLPAVIGVGLTDEEWEHRRRTLLEQADELLHRGECPDGPQAKD